MTLCDQNRVCHERNRSVCTEYTVAEALHCKRAIVERPRGSAWHARCVTSVGIPEIRCGPSWLGEGAAPENGSEGEPSAIANALPPERRRARRSNGDGQQLCALWAQGSV